MKKLLACAILAALPTLSLATPYRPIPPFSGFYQTYNGSITDYLYTYNYSESFNSTNAGYSNMTTPFYVERTAVGASTPLQRYWKGLPQREHVYITATYPQDQINVTSAGYTYEGEAGHVYTQQVPGSVPVYRVTKFDGATGDLVHKFTINYTEVQSLLTQGWAYDHIEGYVPQQTFNSQFIGGYPYLPNGHMLTRRCGLAKCGKVANFRDYYNGYRTVLSTTKPAGATAQVMSFDLWTPDLFSATNNEHIAIGLHGHWDIDFNNIDNVANTARNHHALGIFFGASSCGNAQVHLEAFWPTGNNTSTCNGYANLQNNVTYHVTITVSDAGFLNYQVKRADNNQVAASGTYNGNTFSPAATASRPATPVISSCRRPWRSRTTRCT